MSRDAEHQIDVLTMERDEAQEYADKLAAAIAPADVLGEHSNMNSPWDNALEYAANTHRLVIDDAAVERAARALCESVWKLPNAWVLSSDLSKGSYRAHARSVLAAAVEAGQ